MRYLTCNLSGVPKFIYSGDIIDEMRRRAFAALLPPERKPLSPRTGQRGKTRNTVLSRQFPGGSLKIVPSKSPRNLRRHTARILCIDEADAMPDGPEGSPIELVIKRTLTFSTGKSSSARRRSTKKPRMFARLTPRSTCEFSRFLARLAERSRKSFGVISNGSLVVLKLPPIGARHATLSLDEEHKPAMVEAGRWRATAPDVKGHAGFRLNALVSLLHNARWGTLASRVPESQRLARITEGFRQIQCWRNRGAMLVMKSTRRDCSAASSLSDRTRSRRRSCDKRWRGRSGRSNRSVLRGLGKGWNRLCAWPYRLTRAGNGSRRLAGSRRFASPAVATPATEARSESTAQSSTPAMAEFMIL